MNRFVHVLRRVERRLEAPEPERSRILMEMAGDLEDLYRTYRERGLDEAEALRRTEEWLAPSAPALESLQSVHLPAVERLLRRLGGTARGRLELGLVTLVSLAAVGGGVLPVLRAGVLTASSPGLWVVAGLTAAGLGAAVSQGYALFVRGDRLDPIRHHRLHRVSAAAAGTAVAGLVAAGVRLSLTAVPDGDGSSWEVLWSQLSTASGVGGLGLSASVILTLLWLLLRVRAQAVRRARRELQETVGSMDDGRAVLERERYR